MDMLAAAMVHDQLPKDRSAINLEVAGSGPVSCCFSIPFSFFTMRSSLPYASLIL